MKALLMAGVSLGLAAALIAQQPARDQPTFASVGSASIAGVVVDDETQAPLRRATLSLSRSGIEDIRIVATANDGRFVFDRLPAGSYTLSASKGAYVSMSYGAPKVGMPGSPIVLTDGQPFAAKPIALTHGAVIAGRLTDRLGQPIAPASVRADQFVTVNGERRRRSTSGASGQAQVNAHGEYRIYGLMPGDYVVSATASPLSVQGEVTAEELAWANRPNGPAPAAGRIFTPAPTIFPGTTDAAAGAVITLARGEERTGVDFSVQAVPVARVSGTVTGLDGRPAAGAIVLCVLKDPSQLLPPAGMPTGRSGPDGKFACPGLSPGQYLLVARLVPPVSLDAAGLRGGVPPPPPQVWGQTELTVAGRDVANVDIQAQPGLSISGQLTFHGAGSAAPPDPTRALIRLMPLMSWMPINFAGAVKPDGTFQIDGIVPGSYRLTAAFSIVSPTAWSVRSAVLAGADLTDVPFELTQSAAGLAVTLSDAQTALSGTLTDSAGRPSPPLYVFVFPTNRALWGSARRIQSVRSNDTGNYRMADLPPGEYYLCALTELDTALQTEPSYLEQFVSSSIKITLGEGEKKVQALCIGC